MAGFETLYVRKGIPHHVRRYDEVWKSVREEGRRKFAERSGPSS